MAFDKRMVVALEELNGVGEDFSCSFEPEEEDHDLILELEKYIDSFDHIMMCFCHLASPAFDAALMMFLPVFPPIQHD